MKLLAEAEINADEIILRPGRHLGIALPPVISGCTWRSGTIKLLIYGKYNTLHSRVMSWAITYSKIGLFNRPLEPKELQNANCNMQPELAEWQDHRMLGSNAAFK